MFAIHRKESRRSVSDSIEMFEMQRSHFLCEEAPKPGSLDWALGLYSLALAFFELRENIGAQSISAEDHSFLSLYLAEMKSCLLNNYPTFAPSARILAAFDSTEYLLSFSAGLELIEADHNVQLGRMNWLQNLAHNAYLDWQWSSSTATCGPYSLPADAFKHGTVIPLIPVQ